MDAGASLTLAPTYPQPATPLQWACGDPATQNPNVTAMTSDFVVGMVKGGTDVWAVKAGDAALGPLVTAYEGKRPPGYQRAYKSAPRERVHACSQERASLKSARTLASARASDEPPTHLSRPAAMQKEGALILGVGGDNSNSAIGTFFEGVVLAAYSTDAADALVMANLVSVYGAAATRA